MDSASLLVVLVSIRDSLESDQEFRAWSHDLDRPLIVPYRWTRYLDAIFYMRRQQSAVFAAFGLDALDGRPEKLLCDHYYLLLDHYCENQNQCPNHESHCSKQLRNSIE